MLQHAQTDQNQTYWKNLNQTKQPADTKLIAREMWAYEVRAADVWQEANEFTIYKDTKPKAAA